MTGTPDAVLAAAKGRSIRLVWRNEVGGLTFRVAGGRFVKWSPRDSGLDLEVEAAKLGWAAAFTPVPEVLDGGPTRRGGGS